MSTKCVRGSCFCKKVSYEISGNMGVFQYCHCSRCQKVTGSAHAANIFVAPSDFRWQQGEECVVRYDPPETKYFTTSFCKQCGSSLPWLSKSGKVVIIPAGSLDEDPGIRPSQNIYCDSRSSWYIAASDLPENKQGPAR
ncbi:MAG: GFA family protein [Xanthomonadales bacterium]|nr:GFA family protein [Xanthomonadales bacterium]